ncbi:diguanylate cyclase (GGDEF)-like protein [Stenotrophomonas rhizophila]|uniref:diguanylate cyclase n=2 Tax=Stenotrophomonas rhizophila TaxID=216778 RepID=A0A498CLG1_9GAMM|nr:diguanylate cyclase (GGDEF)-like protein [Stenotrophomonas rhizophila]
MRCRLPALDREVVAPMRTLSLVRRGLSALVCLFALAPSAAMAQRSADTVPLTAQVEQCHALLTSEPRLSLSMARSLLATPSLPASIEIGALGCLGIALRSQGQLGQTLDLPDRLQAAAARADAGKEDRLRAHSMAAHLLLWRGEHSQALTLTNTFLEDAVRERDVQGQIAALMQIAMIRGDAMGDAQGALTYLQKATVLSQHMRRPPNPGDLILYYNYGYALLRMQRHEEANTAFSRAEAIGTRLGGQELFLYRIASHRAEVQRLRGQLADAEARFRSVLSWQARQDPQGHIVTLQRLARLTIDQHGAEAARPLAEQAQMQAERGQFNDEIREGMDLLGDIHILLGHREQALGYARQARAIDSARSKGDILNQLAKLQATAERSIDPAEVNAVQDLDRVRVLRNGALIALLVVVTVATVLLLRMRRQRQRLALLSSTDWVTGTVNRREAERLLSLELAKAGGGQRSVVMLLELDAFKALNEQHGQAAGDAVLRAVTRCLRQHSDRHDRIARWAGGTFLVVRHDTAAAAAQALANRLRAAIERLVVDIGPGQHLTLTATLGVAPLPLFPTAPATLEDSLRAADRALQSARRSGHNAWAMLWGEEAGRDVDLYSLLHDPARAMACGWVSLAGSRPMAWLPPRQEPARPAVDQDVQTGRGQR